MREAVEGFIRAYSPQQLASLTGYPYLCNMGVIISPRYFLKRPFSVVVVWYEAIAKMAPTIHWLE
jgi:uncharacterized membrane protein YhdT